MNIKTLHMNHLTKMLIAFYLFGYGITIQAQSTTPASGGNGTGSGGSVSYTIGQVIYQTFSGTTGTVANGVQQPYEISVATGIEEANGITLEMIVYPNPVTDFIRLLIENYDVENLKYQLYDLTGSFLEDKKIEGNETNIIMSNYLPSTYFLKVFQGNKLIKVFKIIKN